MSTGIPADEALRRLTVALRRHSVPTACPFDLLGWQSSILSKAQVTSESGAMDWTLSPDLNVLWDLGLEWLSMPRTTTEMHAIATLRCDCTAKHANELNHRYGMHAFKTDRELIDSPILCLTTHWFSALSRMKAIPPGGRRSPTIRKIRNRDRWPFSLRQALPRGPDDTVRGLLQWFHAGFHPVVTGNLCSALGQLMDLCGPCILTPILASASLCRNIVNCMNTSVSLFYSGNRHGSSLSLFNYTCLHLFHSSSFFFINLVLEHANETQRRHIIKNDAADIIKALSRGYSMLNALETAAARSPNVVYGYRLEGIQQNKTMLDDLGGAIYDEYPDITRVPITPSARYEWERLSVFTGRSEDSVVWMRFARYMMRLEYSQRCLRPGCAQIFLDRHRLKVCGGCRRVLYCSSLCQKIAWTHGVPHREVCSAIRLVCIALKLPMKGLTAMHWDQYIDRPLIPAVKIVLDHFVALTKSDIMTSRYRSEEDWEAGLPLARAVVEVAV